MSDTHLRMPTLILSSRYTTESKILRKAAEASQWRAFRLEDDRVPAWYEKEENERGGDLRHAIYCTVPTAFRVANRLDAMLLGCSSEWLVDLPEEFRLRKVELGSLKDAQSIKAPRFIRPALGKSFDAAVRTGSSLVSQTSHLPPDLLVHVSEVVEWEVEYRCFVRQGEVLSVSPYHLGAVRFSGYETPLSAPRGELDAAASFAASVLQAARCPAAFVRSMGSGANWLYSHVTLFLALHRYFCSLGDRCLIPSILFFDQPSQVYFPAVLDVDAEFKADRIRAQDATRTGAVDEDLKAVTNLFSKLVEFCEKTKIATGIEPQIIVTDHADNLVLTGLRSFQSLVRAKWRESGRGLIRTS